MDQGDQLAASLQLKEAGNALYKQEDYIGAAVQYRAALAAQVSELPRPSQPGKITR